MDESERRGGDKTAAPTASDAQPQRSAADDRTALDVVAGGAGAAELATHIGSDPLEAPAAALSSLGPEFIEKSLLYELEGSGGAGRGVSLRRAAGEADLPAAGHGPERYQVLKTLGEGGMGKVYLVADRDLKRRLALKVMRPEASAHRRRFVDEAQILAQLEHPNIVPVYDLAASSDKRPYCTMRYVRGHTLEDVIRGLKTGDADLRRVYSVTRLMQIFQEIVQAVGYAHQRGVVHRDLKPANVMLGDHGEVQVLDWGLAKVLDRSELVRETSEHRTSMGQVMGTQSYMPPEQAMGQPVDERADIYALGVILYELLTLERPIRGRNQMELMAALFGQLPEAPRARAPERSIPLELERACLRALSKQPAERQQSAAELLQEVQEWLEASADRERRRALASAKAQQGRAELEEWRRRKLEAVRLAAEAEEMGRRFDGWQPAEEKGELFASQDRARDARRELVDAASRIVGTLEKALGFDDENGLARELLADYYYDRFCEAELRSDRDDAAFYARRVAEYHDGKYSRELTGDGTLTLETEPPGAEATLYELVEEGPVLVERGARRLGQTPLGPWALAMGSYLLVLEHEGYPATRYPLRIDRNKAWSGHVRLRTAEEIGAGFVHVPAGPFLMGGDEQAGYSGSRSEPWVEDFVIGKHPVTMGEYLEFLNDLVRTHGLEAAKGRSPRYKHDQPASTYLQEDGRGGLRLPDVDAEGDSWHERQPAAEITWHDAVAYCAWRSRRDGRELRLPTEQEWEKAARGVDGRWFPWGWRFDPSLCNMRESRRERPALVGIDEFPRDVSVYGVRGLGGNVEDWTGTELVEGVGESRRESRIYRGGSWGDTARHCRAAYRDRREPTNVLGLLGFRLARSL